jgi:hypothetical protein
MMINAGDVNGDGIDDLVIPQRTTENKLCVSIYFGRAVPQSTPDIVLDFPGQSLWQVDVSPLGDINGDGKCDISITLRNMDTSIPRVLIWTDVYCEPFTFSNLYGNLDGVGDVNADGFADMVFFYLTSLTTRNFTFFYGDETCSMVDSLYIGYSEVATGYYSSPLGDVNGDGYADFLAWTNKFWLGGSTITSTPNLQINYHPWASFEFGSKPTLVFGDVNGDGFDDVIGCDNSYFGSTGQGGVWLGGPTMNETRDIALNPPSNYQYRNFGWSKAAGDFDADGYCDIAFSAPFFDSGDTWHTEGKVFVYAGNPSLTDTTVASEDEYIPALCDSDWQIKVYPNPFNPSTTIEYSIPSAGKAKLCVYNIRGQKVTTLFDGTAEKGVHRLVWDGRDGSGRSVASGIYLIHLESAGKSSIRKAMLMK